MSKINSYWERRLKHELDRERKRLLNVHNSAIKKMYEKQAIETERRLLHVLENIDKREEGLIMSDLYSTTKLFEILEYINKSNGRLGSKEYKILDNELLELYEISQETLEGLFPEDLKRTQQIYNLKNIDEKMLIRSAWCPDSKDFSMRIWQNKQTLSETMIKIMGDTLIQGKSPAKIAREIANIQKMDTWKAYRLARTESAHVQIMATAEKYKEFGYQYCIYRAVDPCDECGELDGKRFTLDEIQKQIPHHPNCECYYTLDLNRGK